MAVGVKQLLQDAATTGNGNAVDVKGICRELAFFVDGTGTISAGTLQIEEARSTAYAGTWSPLATALDLTTLSGTKATVVRVTGVFQAVRARLTADVTGGGSVTVEVVGSEEA